MVRNVASHAASSLAFNFVQNEVTMVAELRGNLAVHNPQGVDVISMRTIRHSLQGS